MEIKDLFRRAAGLDVVCEMKKMGKDMTGEKKANEDKSGKQEGENED